MAQHTIASGTTVTSTYLYSGDGFTLTNLGIVTVASGNGVSLHGTNDVLLNQGLITGSNYGVDIGTGGSIANQSGGTITGAVRGIEFESTGSLNNAAGAAILGPRGVDATGVVTIVNYGSIGSTTGNDVGIALAGGGSVTNKSNAVITGSRGINAGPVTTIDNSGSIASTTDRGVELGTGGVVINRAGGVISGGLNSGRGIDLGGSGSVTNLANGVITGYRGINAASITTIDNSGTIGSPGNKSYGVELFGGTLSNHPTGVIYGSNAVDVFGGAATIVNAGSIQGSSHAVQLSSGFANLVVFDPGASFTGAVDGGNALGSSIASTLELASGGSAGTLSGLGSQFIHFAQVTIDSGAYWTLSGTLAGGTLTDSGTLTNSGNLTGANGANGASGNAAGTAGSVAVFVAGGSLINSATIGGGGGGQGSNNPSGNGGVGGDGAVGVDLTSGKLSNSSLIIGGGGGAGGYTQGGTGARGTGGNGAAAVLLVAGQNTNTGHLYGGSGGAGGAALGSSGNGRIGGAGGAGASLSGGSLVNSGLVAGGSGGSGGAGGASGSGGTGGIGGIGVYLTGGSLTNSATGTISGGPGGSGGVAGGTTAASGASGVGVSFTAGGTLANAGIITGAGGAAAVDFGTGASRLILYPTASFTGAVVDASTVTNVLELAGSKGTLSSLSAGSVDFGTTTLHNLSQITIDSGAYWVLAGTNSLASGVTLTSNGTLGVASASTVTVSGSLAVHGTLVDAGTIIGAGGAAAVDFGTVASRLILYPTASFTGSVVSASTVTNVLELAGSKGTLSSLSSGNVDFSATTLHNLSQITVDSGAYWVLSGTNTLSSGVTLTDNGTLDLTGPLTVSGSIAVNGTLTNNGRIIGDVALGVGGYLVNAASKTIVGSGGAAVLGPTTGAATVANSGVIDPATNGVNLRLGGLVTNFAGGAITGTTNGVRIAGAAGTVVSAGSISGGSYAVLLAAGFANQVVAQPGAVFSGTVSGGNSLGAAVTSTLELASGSSTGTLSDLGTQFIDFAMVAVDAGATWTLSGANTLDSGVTLTNAGRLAGVAGKNNSAGGSGYAGALGIYIGGNLSNGGTIAGGAGGHAAIGSGGNGGDGGEGVGVGSLGVVGNSGTISGGQGSYAGSLGGNGGSGGTGISVASGGSLSNSGTIKGGAGNSKYGIGGAGGAGGILSGGSQNNSGRIAGGAGGDGGANSGGGLGGLGVSITGGSLSNSGTILGGSGGGGKNGLNGGAGAVGVSLAGGSLGNSGTITAGNGGAGASGGGGTIGGAGGLGSAGASVSSGGSLSNSGTITGGKGGAGGSGSSLGGPGGAGGAGVYLTSGSLTNLAAGVIRGAAGGASVAGTKGTGVAGANGAGVTFTSGGTLANAGSIAGYGGAHAVDFGSGAARLILSPQAAFTGAVVANSGFTNVLELAPAASAGTLSSLGASSVIFNTATIQGFQQFTIDSGADWELSGSNSLAAGMVLSNAGTLELAGTLTDNGNVTNTSTLIGTGLVTGPIGGTGAIIARGGTLDLAASVTTAGVLDIDAAATLQLGGAASAARTVQFDTAGAATLRLDDPVQFAATIGTVVAGDSIAVNAAKALLNSATLDVTGHILTLTGSIIGGASGTIGTLAFAGAVSPGGFSVASNAVTLSQDVACFLPGTLILTERGDVPVEDLTVGQLVATRFAGLAPVTWIGYRDIDCGRHPDPRLVLPVRVAADAFGPGTPHRDTWLSPDHAVAVGEALIPIRLLLNGATIRQDSSIRHVRYLHVELARHDILLANGMEAESYLDTGNRGMFANAEVPLVLHPLMDAESAQDRRETQSCLPLRCRPAEVEPVWQMLAARAGTLGWMLPEVATTADPALCVALDGRRLKPVVAAPGRQVFVLPGGTGLLRLTSRATAPDELRPWLEDRRSLGVMVRRLRLRHGDDVRVVPLDHPTLRDGWWALEQDGPRHARWTNGDAELPLAQDGPALLEIEFGTLDAYVVARVMASGAAGFAGLPGLHAKSAG